MHYEEIAESNTKGPRECQDDEDNDRLEATLL